MENENKKDIDKTFSDFKDIKDEKTIKFIKNYKTWSVFYDRVLNNKNYFDFNSLIFNIQLIFLCGLAESMFSDIKTSSFERFKKFINLLSIEEKLFFILIINFKKNNERAQKIFEKLNKGEESDELLEELLNIESIEKENKDREIEEIIKSYISNNTLYIEERFEEIINFLYGVRCIIVHFGEPLVGSIMSSSKEIIEHYGEKENVFFTIKYPIKNFFIRALYRYNNIEPPENIVLEMENCCFDKLLRDNISLCSYLIQSMKNKYKIL